MQTIAARATDAVHNQTIHISADRIAFYYDRYLIEADGNVRVTTGDGLTITGQTFSMDLHLNRFLIAGKVHLTSPTGTQDGAAAAYYFDFRRVYFVPITTEPDRWTFANGDYAHPIKGLQMPGDPFEFPDLSNAPIYLTAKSAVVGVGSYARFGGTVLHIAGAPIAPLGAYYVSFSSNPYLAANSLAGANYDATWNVAGNANSISAIHFRYDTVNKTYLAFEQHFASSNAYAVVSVNPATNPSKFWDLNAGWQPSQRFQFHDTSQLHTFSSGLSQPLEAQHYSNALVSQVIGTPGSRKDGTLSLSYQVVNYCLLAAYKSPDDPNQVCGAPGHRAILDNMQTWTLGLQSADYRLGAYVPLSVRANAGGGLIHDTQPLQVFGGARYNSIWNHFVGGTLTLEDIYLGNRDYRFKRYALSGSLQGQRTWYSVPHHVDSISAIASLGHEFSPVLDSFLSYGVVQTNDIYNAGQQAAYPSYTPTIGGEVVPSYAAFAGKATQRTLSLQVNYIPTPDFVAWLRVQHHRDFPIPVPGLFPQPPTNVLGQYEYANYLGTPPYDITGNVFFRISKHFSLDIERTYYFNFGTQKWSPSFLIQVER